MGVNMKRKNAKRCTMAGCDKVAKGRGLCQRHYDMWYGKIRRERDKLRNKEAPFLKFDNPYRLSSGYHTIFEVIRTSKLLTEKQIIRRSRSALMEAGKPKYRIDYALEVIKAKKHSSKKGDYQVRIDDQGRWHLTGKSKHHG